MGVVFTLVFFVILIILAIMLISFTVGTILLIVGFVKKRKYRKDGKKKASFQVMIGVGAFLAGVPAAIILFFIVKGNLISLEDARREEYFLVSMVEKGDYEQVEELLKRGVPADSNDYKLLGGNYIADENSETALIKACRFGEYQMAELLLKYGASPDREGNYGDTAVHEALRSENYDVLELLLLNGADPNYVDASGDTYLVYACRFGDFNAVGTLLKHGADPNVTDSDGEKLLQYENTRYKYWNDYNSPPAGEADRAAIIELLKAYGAEG